MLDSSTQQLNTICYRHLAHHTCMITTVLYAISSQSAAYGAPGLREGNLGVPRALCLLIKNTDSANFATVQRSNNGVNKISCGAP